ncbi:MAG: hypothetical protein ACRETY_09890 [Steroidobacteraceae bacterium]
MLFAIATLAIGSYNNTKGTLLAAAVAFVVTSRVALRNRRWAICLAVFIAMLVMVWWLPMVIVNIWMFLSGHELFKDSPATIFIVLVGAILFAIPATILCVLYVLNRNELLLLLRNRLETVDA